MLWAFDLLLASSTLTLWVCQAPLTFVIRPRRPAKETGQVGVFCRIGPPSGPMPEVPIFADP